VMRCEVEKVKRALWKARQKFGPNVDAGQENV
jgi:hypothetical protein